MSSANYKNINTKNKIFSKISVFAILILILFYFVALPAMNNIKKLKADILNTKIDINNSQKQEDNLDTLAQNLKTIEPQVDKLNNVFITSNKELEFITALESIATRNNIEQEINLNNFPDNSENFTTMVLTINITGNFENLMTYLVDLEASNYYININTLSINKGGGKSLAFTKESDDQSHDTILNMSLTADAFFK